MTEILALANDHWQAGLVPAHGGTIAYGRARAAGGWVDVLRPTPEENLTLAPESASYPLVPWSNRIRDGKLRWAGEVHQLRWWAGMFNAMHGTGFEYPWSVKASGASSATLQLDTRGLTGVNWPWAFVATQTYQLDGPRLVVRMELTNVDDAAFPAGLGHHPYFVRRPALPDGSLGNEALLQVNCERAYELEGCLANGPATDLTPRIDFRDLRPLGEPFVDDCFTGRTDATASARIVYPDLLSVDVEADADFSHVVVYIPQGQGFFAVEAVTNANDAFTLHAGGLTEGLGVLVVEPGATIAAEWALALGEA